MPAKRKYTRKFRKYLKGILQENMSLGTLGSKVVISAVSGDVVTESTWLSSIKATWSLDAFSDNAGDGPILVGVAHSDYSSAEIEEWLENTGSWEEGNLISQEIAKRKIRQVGTFDKQALGLVSSDVLNDGRPISTKCGWILTTGNGLRIWAYNLGSSPLDTTDPVVSVNGHANLWPR